ncbi:14-3-3 protein epsilon-like [Teleopsis dalmanni]|uniref:14-3-3 protein epsilon-like n=1 Tax=Teleopsis dalmanni TaxID=139649 RepID=UPI0018CD47E2|nr:14-3-3 protein epsilon-like [Teleopsis dalmanni]
MAEVAEVLPITNSEERENNVYLAKMAEETERYFDMMNFMKKVAVMGVRLTVKERVLLSVAYKNFIGTRRTSWRIIKMAEQMKETKDNKRKLEMVIKYRLEVEKELHEVCCDILNILEHYLLPNADDPESKVFYYKMKADYHRYLAEFSSNSDYLDAAENSLSAYKCAYKIAMKSISPTDPIRLGLSLNFSVFYYEILNSPENACNLAETAYDLAFVELDKLTDDECHDTSYILQLLHDNLSLWKSELHPPPVEVKEYNIQKHDFEDLSDDDADFF